jgi:hypothetical protein
MEWTLSILSSQDRALYEDGTLSLAGLRSAWERRDPRLAEYIIKLVALDPASTELGEAAREQKPTYFDVINLTSWEVNRRVSAIDPSTPGTTGYSRPRRQRAIGQVYSDVFSTLETEATLSYLPDRLKTFALIEELWSDNTAYSRSSLLRVVREVPMKWGPWRGLKRIFKQSIERQDWEVFAALTVRFEQELQRTRVQRGSRERSPLIPDEDGTLEQTSPRKNADNPYYTSRYSWDNRRAEASDINGRTFEYLLRRAWRVLRRLAEASPAAYPYIMASVLGEYHSSVRVQGLAEALEFRPELWTTDSAPLMQLTEKSSNASVLNFAFSALEKSFREELKQADPAWVLRLARSERRMARRLAVRWFMEPLCGYEQGLFHEMGLQQSVLAFLDYTDETQTGWGSPDRFNEWEERRWLQSWKSNAGNKQSWPALARQYALDYIKANYTVIAEDLPLSKVMWLLRHKEESYRELGAFLLYPGEAKSPYDAQLDLTFWTDLLEDPRTFDMAERAIRRKFSGVELTSAWYADRLLSSHTSVRKLALSFLRDETKYRTDDDWLLFHTTIARSHDAVNDILQLSLYQLSRRDNAGKALLDELDTSFFRMLLVHPKAPCHQALIDWCEGGRLKPSALGFDFLKHLSTKADWEAGGWRTHLGDEETDAHEELEYNGTVGSAVRRWLRTAASVTDIGYTWVKDRVEHFESSHDFIRDIFRREMPFSQLAEDPSSPVAAEAGVAAILEKILSEADAKSRLANFYRTFLLSRHELLRRDSDPNLPPLSEALVLPRSALNFGWFERMAVDEREPIRALGMQLANVEMSRWTEVTPLTFTRLKPLLRDAFQDIRRYLIRSITAPRRPEGRLEVDRPQFKVDDLYAFCFDTSRDLRELGMEIIVRLPQRFGQPEQLLQLSESTDPRVRELVIEVVWRQFRTLSVTEDWQPFERSVVPQSLSLARSQRVVALPIPPPDGLSAKDAKSNRKYLGQGVAKQSATALRARDAFEVFVRSVLFQLPPVRQSPKLPPRAYPLEVSWRNKRTLIIAVRDLAVKDRSFAEFILPILQEFQNVRGKMVREASVTALAYIQMSHPDLSALVDNA